MVSTAAALKYLLVTIIIIVIHLHFGKEGYHSAHRDHSLSALVFPSN